LTSICKPYRENESECNEDYQCPITHYCWYHTKLDRGKGVKKCMEMYSAEVGTKFGWSGDEELSDYTQNGKYCKSGLAF